MREILRALFDPRNRLDITELSRCRRVSFRVHFRRGFGRIAADKGVCVMRRVHWIPATLILVALAAPVGAEEIVHFTSGTSMPVVSHQIDGDMIHVDLGDNAFMAFPLSMVDRVETAGENVMIRRSNTGGTNVMAPRPDPTRSFPVTGQRAARASETNRFSEERESDPAIEVDSHGVAVYRPFANSSHPGKRSVGFTGSKRVREAGGTGAYRGTTQVGTRQVIGGTGPPRRGSASAPRLTGIESRPTPPPTDNTDSQSGQSGSGSKSEDSGSAD
jgi:hypothetical protein